MIVCLELTSACGICNSAHSSCVSTHCYPSRCSRPFFIHNRLQGVAGGQPKEIPASLLFSIVQTPSFLVNLRALPDMNSTEAIVPCHRSSCIRHAVVVRLSNLWTSVFENPGSHLPTKFHFSPHLIVVTSSWKYMLQLCVPGVEAMVTELEAYT